MSLVRRVAAPLWLAAVRVGHRRERLLLTGAGIAASGAMLAVVLGGSVIAQDRNVAERVEALAPDVRAIRLSSLGLTGQSEPYATLDARAQRALGPLLDRSPVRTVFYRESTVADAYVGLGAVDGLGRFVSLRAGRLPRRCRPERCEVLQLRGGGRIPNAPGLRLVVVGRGDLRTSLLFADAIPPARNARYRATLSEHYRRAGRYHQPAAPPLLLAEGVAALSRSPVLATHFRAFGWVVPIEPRTVHVWSVDELAGGIERARSTLQSASSSFELRAPVDELRAASTSSEVAGRRLLLIGGEVAALVLAFIVLAASRLRRDVAASSRRLEWLGTPRWQIGLALAGEAVLLAAVGALAGWLLGAGAAALVARAAGEPARAVLRNSVLSAGAVPLALGLAAVAALVLVAALALRPLRVGGVSVSPLDVAAAGAAAAVAVALARGAADPSAVVAGRGTGVVLLLLPALVAFVAAVVAARLLGPGLRLLERLTLRRTLSLRLAALALARNPGPASVAVAFLVVSVGLALFAETYRSTLVRGQHDQAAFAVPADFVLREDLSRLIPVGDAVPPAALRALDGRAHPVVRASGSVGATGLAGLSVLGLDGETLRTIDGWRDDFSAASPAALAARIEPRQPAHLAGAAIPADAGALALSVRAEGSGFALTASVEARDGSFVQLDLGRIPGGTARLRARLPRRARGGRLVSLHFEPPRRLSERGADSGGSAESVATLGPLVAARAGGGTSVVTDFAGWLGVGGARRLGGERLRLRLSLSTALDTDFRPVQPTDRDPVPVLVSPRLAAVAGEDGGLALQVAGEQLAVRVVATADRFPGARADFVVADRDLLLTALNTAQPGIAAPNELWVNGPRETLERRLRAPPFDVLELRSRSRLEAELERDPIARASFLLLVAAAAVALVLALVGVLLGTVAELRDDRGELFDLEAQGLGPGRLRSLVRLRALVLVACGLAGAALSGLALSLLAVRLVALTANATRPEPPLLLTVSWPVVAVALVVLLALGTVLVAGATARAFRAPAAGRSAEVGA